MGGELLSVYLFYSPLLVIGMISCQEDIAATAILAGDKSSTSLPTTTDSSTEFAPLSTNPQHDTPHHDHIECDPPEVILETASGVYVPQDSTSKNKYHFAHTALNFFNKFSPVNLVRPVYDKLSSIKDYLGYHNRPNYGGVQSLSPQQIWEKFHEKGHHFLTGINGAIFGLAPLENHDYPFAYRRLPEPVSEKKNR